MLLGSAVDLYGTITACNPGVVVFLGQKAATGLPWRAWAKCSDINITLVHGSYSAAAAPPVTSIASVMQLGGEGLMQDKSYLQI
jgi:hypothetical protein